MMIQMQSLPTSNAVKAIHLAAHTLSQGSLNQRLG